MTAEPPESLVTEGVRSVEVRWIFPGQLDTAVAGWSGRFPTRTDSREDPGRFRDEHDRATAFRRR